MDMKTFGSFVPLKRDEVDKQFEIFWSLVRFNAESIEEKIIPLFKKWKEENNISTKYLTLYLDISPSKYYKIVNLQEKLTLSTICELCAMIKMKLTVNLEKLDENKEERILNKQK